MLSVFECQDLLVTLPLTVLTSSFIVNIHHLTSQRQEYVLRTIKTLLQHAYLVPVLEETVRNDQTLCYF